MDIDKSVRKFFIKKVWKQNYVVNFSLPVLKLKESTLQKNNFLHPFLKKIKPHCYKLNFESTLHFKYVLLLGASMMP